MKERRNKGKSKTREEQGSDIRVKIGDKKTRKSRSRSNNL